MIQQATNKRLSDSDNNNVVFVERSGRQGEKGNKSVALSSEQILHSMKCIGGDLVVYFVVPLTAGELEMRRVSDCLRASETQDPLRAKFCSQEGCGLLRLVKVDYAYFCGDGLRLIFRDRELNLLCFNGVLFLLMTVRKLSSFVFCSRRWGELCTSIHFSDGGL